MENGNKLEFREKEEMRAIGERTMRKQGETDKKEEKMILQEV